MFTLKLYRNGPLPPYGRTIIMEVSGIWVDRCENDVLHVQPFRKTVGVQDEEPLPDFYVGGTWHPPLAQSNDPRDQSGPQSAIHEWNYCGWGVLETAEGKTTEMLR